MKKKPLFLVFLLPAVLFGSILVCLHVLNELRDITVSPPGSRKGRLALHERQGAGRDTDATRRSRAERGGVWSEKSRPRVAIIIDDIGQHHDLDLSFIKLDLPLSLAILPLAPFTDLMVREATRKGREILLHQPMEPNDYPNVKPGPGALLLSMNEHEIREVLDRNLTQVSGARGVNNHMGSSFTESREKMSMVVRELKRRGLFFIDSRTTKSTVGFEEAKKLGLPAGQRTVFLDNDLSSEAIWDQIEYLLKAARECGAVIGIGHPYHQTIDILQKIQNRLSGEVIFVPASDLVK
jgi:polysaccharide deacetylase 2 family uncharacterized protein YibQ